MAVTVGTETFVVDGQRNYLLMQGSDQYLRRFNFQPTWTNATLGILYSIPSNVSSFKGGLAIGLTTSANGAGIGYKQGRGSNIVRGIYAAHGLIGVEWGYGGVSDYIYTYGTDPSGSYYTSQLLVGGAFSNGSRVVGSGGDATFYIPTTESVARKGMMILTLFRNSPSSISSGTFCIGSLVWNYNYTDNTLLTVCGENSPTIGGSFGTFVGPSGILFTNNDDVNYPLDTINLFWSGSVPMRIYQIALVISQ